ncbi:MAG TPA: NAD-dependent epimerase/dehydratase family protein [Chthoniobacterales bacterium]|jgi:UDP-glucose 4-epimerase
MKCLLTGASGFLGGAVGRAAMAAGHEVVAIGRTELASVEVLTGVVRTARPDCVLHFAGSASVGESFAEPAGDFECSTALWFRVLDAVRRSGARPLVAFASSAAVYGSPEELPTPETAARRPESPYGFHKLMSEIAAEEFACCFGLSVVALRFFSIFGPHQRRLLVWELFDQLRHGSAELRLRGTGAEERDYLAESEAGTATIGLVEALRPGAGGFHALNVASGASVSVRELAERLLACSGCAAKIVVGKESLPGNPAVWRADVSALRNLLPGWHPRSFAESLAECVTLWNEPSPASGVSPATSLL